MAESPRRENLPPYWQAHINELEAKIDELCHRLERARQRATTQRNKRRLEEAKNLVLRDEVKRLKARVELTGKGIVK